MNSRLEFLSRRNHGKALLEKHLPIFSGIIQDKSLDFIELSQSDQIRATFFKKLNESKENNSEYTTKTYLEGEFDSVSVFKEYLEGFIDEDFFWITNYSEFYGILKITLRQIESSIEKIIEFDGDSLSLISCDFQKGIYLDFYENEGKNFYELSIWCPPASPSGKD